MKNVQTRLVWLAIVLAIPGAGTAGAQGSAGGTRQTTTGPASPPASTATPVQPGQGGVGGTGLGNVPEDDLTGKGLSVKGPAGQLVPSDAIKAK